MSTLLSASTALLAGLLTACLFRSLKLPNVTAYLIAGVLVGPYCLGGAGGLGFAGGEVLDSLAVVSQGALAFIAFSIGSEFRLESLKSTGRRAAIIGVVQALAATLMVDAALVAVHLLIPEKLTLPQALTLGAIATATAPAATLMVVRQYKAKGPLTDLLLPIVALDDAVGLVVFAVSFGAAKALSSGAADLVSILADPLVEIAASLLLGAALGFVLARLSPFFGAAAGRLSLVVAMVLLAAALSEKNFQAGPVRVGFSSLLVCMMMGALYCNLSKDAQEMMDAAESWSDPLLALFFVISGAQLELSVFTDRAIVAIGLIYILTRSAGKYLGALCSARGTGCGPKVSRYLGVTLLPQAGVAMGMCATAMELGSEGALIRNITLFSVLVYELAGPLLTRWALTRAGDIAAPVRMRRRRARRLIPLKSTRG